jgi:hypothetical protein
VAALEMIYVKNGEGNNPLYQIGIKHADGTHTIVNTKFRKEHQAVAYLAELETVTVEEAPAIDAAMDTLTITETGISEEKVMVEVEEETTIVPNYKSMTKLELEETMRFHNIELDRRKSKKDLLQEVDMFFKGNFSI